MATYVRSNVALGIFDGTQLGSIDDWTVDSFTDGAPEDIIINTNADLTKTRITGTGFVLDGGNVPTAGVITKIERLAADGVTVLETFTGIPPSFTLVEYYNNIFDILESFVFTGADTLDGGTQDDVLSGYGGIDTIHGGAGADTIDGGGAGDNLFGDGGDDLLMSLDGDGPDSIDGGANIDQAIIDRTTSITAAQSLNFANAAVSVSLTDGTTIIRAEAIDFSSGSGNDTITASNDARGRDVNRLSGGEGIDTLTASSNGATLNGGADNDTLNGAAGDDQFDGGEGNDTIRTGGNSGAAGFYDIVAGGGGDDTITANANGNAVIYGDELGGGFAVGNDTINAAAVAIGFEITLFGGNGSDVLTGSAGDNLIRGDDDGSLDFGNDTLIGGAGTDTMIGGDGDDIYDVDRIQDIVTELSNEGTDTIRSSVISLSLLSYSEIEHATLLGSVALNLTGDGDDNTLNGNSGANSILGGNGSDELIGGAGNDVLNGGSGADEMSGGADNDIYYIDSLSDAVNEAIGFGTQDTIVSEVTVRLDTTTTAQGVEHAVLQGSSNATVVGTLTYNIITGNTGNNYLAGYGGNDTVSGGVGNDTVFGGDGKDLLSGGIGNDVFLYSFIADSGGTQPRRDVITDFSQTGGNDDWIDLALTDANGALAGNQAFTFIGTAAFSGAAGELRYFQDLANNRTIIEGNVRVDAASPGAEFSIELTGLKTLTAGLSNAFDIIL